jgi:hypothetical protein
LLACGEWLEDNVLAPVPHRQCVFSLPKQIRPFFRHRRRYLGELCRPEADTILNRKKGRLSGF